MLPNIDINRLALEAILNKMDEVECRRDKSNERYDEELKDLEQSEKYIRGIILKEDD